MKSKKIPEVRFSGFTDGWKQRKWEDTVIISTNMVNPKSGEYDSLKHIGPGNIESFTGRLLDNVNYVKDDKLISGKFRFYPYDIIYGKINPQLGKYTMPDFEGLASADAYVLNSQRGIDQKFLYTILQGERFFKYSISVSMRSGIPKINRDELNQFSFLAPMEKEQKCIGILFEQLDNMITLHQYELDNLKQTKQGFLQKMFPKEGAKVPEIRFPGFSEEWEKRKLGEISENFEYGLNASATEFDGIHKYIRITDIDDNTREFKNKDITSPNIDFANSNQYILQKGDILFARTGASVGKSYHYDEKDGLLYFAGFLIRARIKTNYDSEFVFQNTLTDLYDNYIQITSQRSGQPGVNAQEYANFSFLLPSLDEQIKIGKFFKQLDNTITLHQNELDLLKETKKALLQKMFI